MTRLQRVFTNITDAQAKLLWDLLAGHVEDQEAELEHGPIPGGDLAEARMLLDRLDSAVAEEAVHP